MGFRNGLPTLALAAILIVLPAAASSKSSTSSSRHASAASAKLHKTHATAHSRTLQTAKKRVRGQQGIDATRVREIQSALIREHYLDGEANGAWDARTKEALVKFQGDNGWQTKKVPDARAIIKLGLGPSRAALLNPDTAFVTPQPTAKGGGTQQPQH